MKENISNPEAEKKPGILIRPSLFFNKTLGHEVYENFRNFALDKEEQKQFNFETFDFGDYFYVIFNKFKSKANGEFIFKLPEIFSSEVIDYFIFRPKEMIIKDKESAKEDSDEFLSGFIKYFIAVTIPINEGDKSINERNKYLVLGSKSFLQISEPFKVNASSGNCEFYPVFGSCVVVEKTNGDLKIKSYAIKYNLGSNEIKILETLINPSNLEANQKTNLTKIIKEQWGLDYQF
ncbi:MAG: hypothetical protein KatS3mg095_0282 [Candidatus Parcubacteria bacterium]|nr:MAG: hypothetical protein KatS3mg095_0282 [Candidatus Parcubacteria bacterium]